MLFAVHIIIELCLNTFLGISLTNLWLILTGSPESLEGMLNSGSYMWAQLKLLGVSRLSVRLSHPEALRCTQGCLHTPRLCTGSASLPISHPHSDFHPLTSTHTLAHTSLSIRSLDQGNPLTYKQRCVLEANSVLSKCRHLWSWCVAQAPQRWYNKAFSSFVFTIFAQLLALLHADNYWACMIY